MAKKKVFISYEHDHDFQSKENFVQQSKNREAQFSMTDSSLLEAEPIAKWVTEARRRIGECDVFMVLLGPNTHNAPGVRREVDIAMGLKKNLFQLMPQGRNYGTVHGAGEVVPWKWKSLEPRLSTDPSRVRKKAHGP